MKKSEAAAKIRQYLLGKPIDMNRFEYDILEAVEAIGMAPPNILKASLTQEVKEIDLVLGKMTLGPVYELKEVHEWEPE